MFKNKKGFTLIELLVVIAIIGVLASIVLASLNNARLKSRNARRITDIKQLQLASELYFDGAGAGQYAGALTDLVTGNYIPSIPIDPLGSGSSGTCRPNYCYAVPAAGSRTTYHLGTRIEDAANNVQLMASDKDCNSSSGAGCSGGVSFSSGQFDGTAADVYDVQP
ncbi:MAG: prepilin-type N-terminal cleavage/methylation domain-containing protein [Candidatus Sungbacteria bacterium]|nr:prepilin-type N-terminal cleavage/methylation domain-containing protein [Candidatus Sungbacteria bacterium]